MDSSSTGNENDDDSSSASATKVFPANLPMSKAEMKAVLNGSILWMKTAIDDGRCAITVKDAKRFAAYLVTSVLVLIAPRTQVLAQIKIGSSFTRDNTDGKFWIKLRAEQSKNNKPVLMAIPTTITPYFTYYLTVARETILRETRKHHRQQQVDGQYVFLKKDGTGPRSDFQGKVAALQNMLFV